MQVAQMVAKFSLILVAKFTTIAMVVNFALHIAMFDFVICQLRFNLLLGHTSPQVNQQVGLVHFAANRMSRKQDVISFLGSWSPLH